MKRMMNVRWVLWCVAAGILCACSDSISLEEAIRERIAGEDGSVGGAVIFDGRDTVVVNDEVRYPMMSVFKFHQALAVADYLQRHALTLETEIPISPSDLKPNTYSPLRDRYPDGNVTLTVGDLLTYTLQQSDNNACDILFDYIGGTDVADSYIRSLGFDRFEIVATEDDMHRDTGLCYRNWTSPLDAAGLLDCFLTDSLFDEASRNFIRNTMISCRTGQDRLVAPLLGTGAVVGHKTGTGDRDGDGRMIGLNDIGFVLLPNEHYYTIAVFVTGAKKEDAEIARIVSDVSDLVYRYAVKRGCLR